MKDICLELRTSIIEVEKLIGKSNAPNIKDQFKDIIKRIEDSVVKLEKL